ncbi:hypothetical protein D3C81_1684500 [compost metagenome]
MQPLAAGAGGDDVVLPVVAEEEAGLLGQCLPVPHRTVGEAHFLHAVLVRVVAGLRDGHLVPQPQAVAVGEDQRDAVAIAAHADIRRRQPGHQLQHVAVAGVDGMHVVVQDGVATAVETVGVAARRTIEVDRREGLHVHQPGGDQQVVAIAAVGEAVAG